jgi:CRP/FNR family cyclic AMP-dependent transcriptional regulator
METTQVRQDKGVGLRVSGDLFTILRKAGAHIAYEAGASICSQGDSCAGLRYVVDGLVKLTTVSSRGRAAILGFLWTGDFFGESCLAGRARYQFSAEALARTSIIFVKSRTMKRLIAQEPAVAAHFVQQLLLRNRHIEEDLLGHIFDSSEQRLARILLSLWEDGQRGKTPSILKQIDQDTLAALVGTTRPRVNFFMNKFRKMGWIEYAEGPGIVVNPSLQTFLLNDSAGAS